ncbi:hypothetical protein BO94DRAFT_540389 [Aspergillus sclerotioniger CBS 115572]|uniref:Uncharacterized protein n=1 Tax=Aspergillus sclerotioniger CBS 115572 TaxID=1450535 RepID=A0A317V2J7_9EURO|nr:hypothetical protein BO94DRAFT_540389 [Aspergillus sclerotioniger CBS 115572]PWY67591.1 hypothetical protein BO94DRAFT_540389 [Aspergillus sclerotioniger CBS 115572]
MAPNLPERAMDLSTSEPETKPEVPNILIHWLARYPERRFCYVDPPTWQHAS